MNLFLRSFVGLCLLLFSVVFLTRCEKDSQNANTTGKGGSMARFTIAKNHLYVIDNQNLKVFDVLQAETPVFITEINVGFSIETVFPYNNNLFIGSRNGMYIYNISNPDNPIFVTEVLHFISCDPVVVNDSLAFVTLRSGGDCRTTSNVNQLEIYNISNLNNPSLRSIHQMETPYGLGIDSNLLFICHGETGLGVYNISNVDSLSLIRKISGIKSYDVITHNKILFVIGETGFYQYNYMNPDSIYLLSQIVKGQ